MMRSVKQRNRDKRQRTRMRRHKASILSICGVILLLTIILSVGSMSLQAKNKRYKQQEAELTAQLKEEKEQDELLGIIAEKVSEEDCTEQCGSCQKYCPASEECMGN